MRLQTLLFAVAALIVGSAFPLASPSEAQIAPLTFELRTGGSLPVGGMNDPAASWAGAVDEGYSFGMAFAYTFRWYMAAYGGFSQHRLACPAQGCGRETDLAATGFDAGIRWILGSGRVIPMARTGLVTYRMEGRVADEGGGTRPVTSKRAVGVEAGVGVSVGVTRRLVLSPGVRYLRMEPRFVGVGQLPVEMVVADVGVMLGF